MQQKKLNYNAIIFDMDGTIIDTNNAWRAASLKIMSKKKNIPNDKIKFILKQIEGLAIHKSCALIKSELGINDPLELLIKEKADKAHSFFQKELKFIPGFKNFFKIVQQYKLKTALATNAPQETLELVDKHLNLKQFFGEHMYTVKCVDNICKPAPDIYLYAASKLNIPTYNCLAIEDSTHGIDAAQAAGIFCIGLNSSKDIDRIKQANFIAEDYESINLEHLLHHKF